MPAYIRLLSYFSNFILLASFLGIGIGCLLAPARVRLFAWFPVLTAAVIGMVHGFRLEVELPTSGSIYFSSGTEEPVVAVETTLLLPVLFVIVAALLATASQRMAREMAAWPPLEGYTLNVAGSLAGVIAFGVISWLELAPVYWFATAFALATLLLVTPEPVLERGASAVGAGPASRRPMPGAVKVIDVALLAASLVLVFLMGRAAIWSPYYKITVGRDGPDTVIEVNNIFHQSMAPVAHKEYFYRWPYTVFGNTFENVLILGAGSGTDVAAALMHGAKHVDAVEIDPTILRLGRELHPDDPYDDPRVTVVNDDARHFLRTTDKKYDLVVFALIDSLTLQSSFSGVRLESYMFTEESFRAVRDRLAPDGLLVVYNYFRERWLVDRLANIAASAFESEPRVHVHEARAYLGVLMAGPRLASLKTDPVVPDRVAAYNQPAVSSPARMHLRDPGIEASTDDWPFLYLETPHVPRHYLAALALILVVSVVAVLGVLRGQPGAWSWQFFFLGAGFMLLETKAIIQFALLWGSTWVVASLAIAAVLTMALAANFIVFRVEIRRQWLVGAVLVVLLGFNALIPIGRVTFDSRAAESVFYAILMFSPILCAGLLFGSAIKRSTSLPRDYGTNLLGAMVGGIAEYFSLVTGFAWLLLLVAAFYVAALLTARRAPVPSLPPALKL